MPDTSSLPKNNNLGKTLLETDKSLMKSWLKNIDEDTNKLWFVRWPEKITKLFRLKKWHEIGWDVFKRKSLMIAAAYDLQENDISDPLKLAATDVFVEKAQRLLTLRGRLLYIFGALTGILAIAILAYTTYYLSSVNILDLLHVKKPDDNVSNAFLTMVILKSTTAGAFVIAIVYFLISLSRALLHEATVLYSRRHSLRFGRLYVYLMSNKLNREDLVEAFKWNEEFSTAFKDIQVDQITKSPIMKVLETASETIKSAMDVIKSLKPSSEHERYSDHEGKKTNDKQG